MKRIIRAITLPFRMLFSLPLLIGFYLVGFLHLRAERARLDRERNQK